MDWRSWKREPPPSPGKSGIPVTGTYTVTVTVSFPVSAPQAVKVLERWWAFKEKRKRYMRDRRAGRVKG